MKNTDFENRLETLNLSKKDFAKLVGMPYQTLMNWKQKDQTPTWVEPFLYHYEKSLSLDELIKTFKKYNSF